jgi:pimeloyl-ACP methyl ester carboxylesterase
MNRRIFLAAALALGLAGSASATMAAAAPAPRFEPTRFSVQVRGSGPDVILIPGLTSGREVWNGTVAAVPGYRYHLIQVGGFAGEPARANARGPVVEPLAEEIARYISSRGLNRPAVVGHSMGGTIALMIGERHPELAGRIMTVDILPEPGSLFGGGAGSPLANSFRNWVSTPGGRRLVGSLLNAFSPPESNNSRSDPNVVAQCMHELAEMDLGPQLSRLRAPLTVVYASSEPQARAANDRTFAAAYAPARGARLVRIDNSGHMVMLDQPARFNAALREFLR